MHLLILGLIMWGIAGDQVPTPVPKLTPKKGVIRCGTEYCVEIQFKNNSIRLYLSDTSEVLLPLKDKMVTLHVQTSQTEQSKNVMLTKSTDYLAGSPKIDEATLSKSRVVITVSEKEKAESFDFIIDEKRSPFKK